ncbi:reverse transcriptase [Tanacetum coccineum]
MPCNRVILYIEISQAKDCGGLGFRDFSCFNLALLAKQGWRLIMNPGSFWCHVLKGIYFPHSNFLTASKGSRPSWLWQSLLQGKDLLLRGIRWQVGEIFSASDPLMAELLAIRSACRLAITYGWHNATVESDSKIAISLVSSKVEPPWALAAICRRHQKQAKASNCYLLSLGQNENVI